MAGGLPACKSGAGRWRLKAPPVLRPSAEGSAFEALSPPYSIGQEEVPPFVSDIVRFSHVS
jgi:hypothetical protein